MKTKRSLMVCLLGVHIVILAADLPPLPLRDKGKSPILKMREVHIQNLRKWGVEHSLPCAFRYQDKYFGYLDDVEFNLRGKMPLHGGVCYDANNGVVQSGWAKLGADGSTWQPNLSNADKRELKGAFHFYQIKASNASGWAVTVDDTTGEEDYRVRRLHYCLIHPPKALCGDGEMGDLKDGRKGDLTPYSLQILRSVEFIDDALPTTGKSTPATPAAGK